MIFEILVFSILLVLASCQDYDDFYRNNRLLADLRRRDSIPLHDINRQWSKDDEYSFRRTRKIRSLPPRTYEVSFLAFLKSSFLFEIFIVLEYIYLHLKNFVSLLCEKSLHRYIFFHCKFNH